MADVGASSIPALACFAPEYHAGVVEDWCRYCVKLGRFYALDEWLRLTLDFSETPGLLAAMRALARED